METFGASGDAPVNPYNLHSCGDNELLIGLTYVDGAGSGSVATKTYAENSMTFALVDLSIHIFTWKHDLLKVGFPQDLLDPVLNRYEQQMLKAFESRGAANYEQVLSASASRLAAELNKINAEQKLHAFPVRFECHCGGGGIPVTFIPPNNSDLYITSAFFVVLCKRQDVDPFDFIQCNRWKRIARKTELNIAGLYYYMVRKNGKVAEVNTFTADSFVKDGNFRLPLSEEHVGPSSDDVPILKEVDQR